MRDCGELEIWIRDRTCIRSYGTGPVSGQDLWDKEDKDCRTLAARWLEMTAGRGRDLSR